MALVAHRMMLSARTRRTHQQVARNKVGVLLVPSVADYYSRETEQPQQQQQQPQQQPQQQLQKQQPLATPTQLELKTGNDSSDAKFSFTPPIAATTGWTESNKLANSSSDLQIKRLVIMDNSKEQQLAGQEVNKIITQAALEHEKKKQQRFMQAQTQNVDPSKVAENNKKTNQNPS
ncbi:hypothetical protein AWZ03_010913 [Drosophila navojoa]|uniref:Uncharacterized protein n=1 Tax=Drosophila navojoa TaxID=7232 RepID=A0A484B1S2_DRONA|nr:hypothetical protein AWZ03_010913 [Drosophila navojoa]